MISFTACEACGKETECSDCIASKPVRKEEIERDQTRKFGLRKIQNEIYRSTPWIEYPSRKRY